MGSTAVPVDSQRTWTLHTPRTPRMNAYYGAAGNRNLIHHGHPSSIAAVVPRFVFLSISVAYYLRFGLVNQPSPSFALSGGAVAYFYQWTIQFAILFLFYWPTKVKAMMMQPAGLYSISRLLASQMLANLRFHVRSNSPHNM